MSWLYFLNINSFNDSNWFNESIFSLKFIKIFLIVEQFLFSIHDLKISNVNKIVDDYLLGYNWIVNYYHNTNSEYNNIDLTWYYNHNRSPLLKDIVNNYNYKLLIKPLVNTFLENKIKYMTPLEHYLYVSPIDYTSKHLEEDLIKIFTTMPIGKIKKLVYFITRNSKYYYPLNKIYNNMSKEKYVDCSSSIFISKCHLLFMENYIDMMEYIINFRKLN